MLLSLPITPPQDNRCNDGSEWRVIWPIIMQLYYIYWYVYTLRPKQNGRHFADHIFKCIFLNENTWIPIKISLKFVHKCPINNIPTLVQIMAWHRPGDKPLSEPMVVSLLMHICITWPQWVKCLIWKSLPYISLLMLIYHLVHYIPEHTLELMTDEWMWNQLSWNIMLFFMSILHRFTPWCPLSEPVVGYC